MTAPPSFLCLALVPSSGIAGGWLWSREKWKEKEEMVLGFWGSRPCAIFVPPEMKLGRLILICG
jgi:hypothetical protein